MDLSRQEYPALLASLQPEQAVNILSDRVELITKINSDIADWLHERRKIEEAYATSLRKLAQRPQQDGASTLGIFQMPWQRIVSGTENLAQSHEMLAAKIESDVESPLRQFATRNREMQNLNKSQSNLTSIAKEFGSAQKKAEKSRGSNARSKLDETSRDWDSQAPFVFEQLQALDETRVNHLRDVLTQFQTHEVDQVERNRLSAESCLNALLNVETADEIKTFAARVAEGRGSLLRRPSSAAASTTRPMSSSLGPPPTPPPRGTQGRSSQQPGSDAGQDRLSPLPDKTPHKSSLGGLKRLGTVISRRKSTAPPPPPSSSEKRKEKGRSFAPFRRGDSSRSFQDLEESGRDLTPVASSQNDGGVYRLPSHEPPSNEPSRDTLTSPLTTVNGTNLYRTDELPESLQPQTSIYSTQPQTSSIYSTPPSQYQAPPPQELSAAPSSPEYVSPPSDAISRAQQEATMTPSETDESARNLTIRDQPIPEDESEAQKALDNIQNQLRMQAQSSGLNRVQGSVRGRRDVRNTIFVPSAPTPEAPTAKPSATAEMIPALGLATGAVAAGGAAAATAVGLNDIASPIKRSETSNTVLEESHPRMGSDANSVHSAQSLAGMVQHPELTKQGLNASIVETVNTWFAEGGAVSRSFVVGEVAMAYNATGMHSEKSEETIRLENFQVLEKVAANPTFVTATTPMNGKQREGEETAGEYSINTSVIRRPSPTVALKYQLHIDPENQGALSPLLLSPAWQIQEGQVSVIVVYGPNPGFAGPEGGVILKNVVVSVNLDVSEAGAGRATNAMMRPTEGAAFRRKQSAVVWRLGEVRLAAMTTQEGGEEERKLLVRFITQGGMPKRGSVDVKFEVVGGLIGSSALGVKRMIEASAALESDPFADDMEGSGTLSMRRGVEWEDVPMERKLVAGRYCAA